MIPTNEEMKTALAICRILLKTDFIMPGDIIEALSKFDQLIERDMPWDKFSIKQLHLIAESSSYQETTDRATSELVARPIRIKKIIELLAKTKKPPLWEMLAKKLCMTPMTSKEMITVIGSAKNIDDLQFFDCYLAQNITFNGLTNAKGRDAIPYDEVKSYLLANVLAMSDLKFELTQEIQDLNDQNAAMKDGRIIITKRDTRNIPAIGR